MPNLSLIFDFDEATTRLVLLKFSVVSRHFCTIYKYLCQVLFLTPDDEYFPLAKVSQECNIIAGY